MYRPLAAENTDRDFTMGDVQLTERNKDTSCHSVAVAIKSSNNNLDPAVDDFTINVVSLTERKTGIPCCPDWRISQLKESLYDKDIKAGKNIRFIFNGAVLDDAQTLHSYGIKKDSWVHCVIQERRNEDQLQDSRIEENQIHEFDHRPRNIPGWEQIRNRRSDADLSDDTTRATNSTDFLLGFVMGVVLGVLALIWFSQRHVSRRQKIGILAGIGVHILFGMVRYALDEEGPQLDNASGTGSGTFPIKGTSTKN